MTSTLKFSLIVGKVEKLKKFSQLNFNRFYTVILSFLERDRTVNIFHYSLQGVTAFLSDQRYKRSPFLIVCCKRFAQTFVNFPERFMSVFDRL